MITILRNTVFRSPNKDPRPIYGHHTQYSGVFDDVAVTDPHDVPPLVQLSLQKALEIFPPLLLTLSQVSTNLPKPRSAGETGSLDRGAGRRIGSRAREGEGNIEKQISHRDRLHVRSGAGKNEGGKGELGSMTTRTCGRGRRGRAKGASQLRLLAQGDAHDVGARLGHQQWRVQRGRGDRKSVV